MSQVFVKKTDLADDTKPVPVVASHPDVPAVALSQYGSGATRLVLPTTKLSYSIGAVDPLFPLQNLLMDDFRDEMPMMANGEAERRINDAFPDYMQRNANADINNSTMKYGADPGAWPPDAQQRKAEADRGWNYIAMVRTSSDALSSQITTVDPTDDAHWPTVIAPVYIPPVTPT